MSAVVVCAVRDDDLDLLPRTAVAAHTAREKDLAFRRVLRGDHVSERIVGRRALNIVAVVGAANLDVSRRCTRIVRMFVRHLLHSVACGVVEN